MATAVKTQAHYGEQMNTPLFKIPAGFIKTLFPDHFTTQQITLAVREKDYVCQKESWTEKLLCHQCSFPTHRECIISLSLIDKEGRKLPRVANSFFFFFTLHTNQCVSFSFSTLLVFL